MNIFIAVPCMDQVPAQFAQSLSTLKKVGDCTIAFQCGSLVYTSRNNLAMEAIKRNADFMMWFDSDMMFAPSTMEKLVSGYMKQPHNTIMTGMYFRRTPPFTPTLFKTLEIDEETKTSSWTDIDAIPNEPFEVAGCGFGCVFAPIQAFSDVLMDHGRLFSPIGEVGEDLSFCWRARKSGWRIVCDPSIELGHVGHHIITREFFEEYHGYQEKEANNG